MATLNNLIILIFIAMCLTDGSSEADFFVRGRSANAPLSAGQQTYPIAGFGDNTPVAAILLFGGAATPGVPVTHKSIGLGATDCTNQWAMAMAQQDNVSDHASFRGAGNDKIFTLWEDYNPGVEIARAEMVSCGVNEITLNWTNVSGRGEFFVIIYIGGSDVTAAVGDTDIVNTVDALTDVNVGIEADFILTADQCVTQPTPLAFVSNRNTIGFTRRTAAEQMSYSVWIDHTTGVPVYVGNHLSSVNGQFGYAREGTQQNCVHTILQDFDATGWSYKTLATNPFGYGDLNVYHLALALTGGASIDVARVQTSTTSGAQSWTGLAHTPDAALLLATTLDGVDFVADTDLLTHEAFALGYADTQFQGSVSAIATDGVNPSDAYSMADLRMVNMISRGGVSGYQQTFTGFAGSTLNYTQDLAAALDYEIMLVTFDATTPAASARRRVGVIYYP